MNRLLASTAAVALCVFWTGAASAGDPDAAQLTSSAAAEQAQPGDNDPDIAAEVKKLPSNLDGEIRRAQILRANGDYKESAKVLGQIMIVAPDDARVVGEFGKVMVQEGRSQDAQAFLKRAIELQPNEWTFYSALGVAYDQLDDHAHAKAAYEHALALKPGESTVLNNYAVSRMLAGDLPGAQRLLAAAQTGGGKNPKIENNVDMLASMRAPAAAPVVASVPTASTPRPLQTQARSTTTVATLAPVKSQAKSSPGVVMEKVPVDPLAGPVASAHPQGPKLAKASSHATKSAAKQKPVLAATNNSAPTLRTASQAN